MPIKINDKIMSIPPYISTSWSRIAGLHMKGSVLAITLVDGETIQVPSLDAESIQSIFQHHAVYLENESIHSIEPIPGQDLTNLKGMMDQIKGESSIRFAFGPSLENLGVMMQHNPDQADSPPLPEEILQKIAMISKIIAPSDDLIIPKAVADCNCFHCQVSRALNPSTTLEIAEGHGEDVSEEDLKFQQWDIVETGNQQFTVINRLDTIEKYNVCLEPVVGCTCGISGCEHVLAVLKS